MDIKDLAAWLGERLDKLEAKADATQVHCAQIDVTLTGQAKDIAHHITRTDALETRVEQVAAEVKPLSALAQRIKGAAALVGLLVGVLELWRYWRG